MTWEALVTIGVVVSVLVSLIRNVASLTFILWRPSA